MSYFHYNDHERVVVNLINDTVSILTESVSGLTGQLLTTRGARFLCQSINALQKADDVPLGKGAKIFGDRFLEDQPISSHGLEGL